MAALPRELPLLRLTTAGTNVIHSKPQLVRNTVLNLTPHSISIFDEKSNKTLTLPPSGVVARVSTQEEATGFVAVEGLPVPVVRKTFGKISGLPEDGESCIVSGMVLEALKADPQGIDLTTVYAPDTGASAVRDEQGRIQAVVGLVGAA